MENGEGLGVIGGLSLEQRFRTYNLQRFGGWGALIVARKSHATQHVSNNARVTQVNADAVIIR
jgi:hypothetical protein